MAKAATSVTEVTVMDTPACFSASDIRSGIECPFSSSDRLSRALIDNLKKKAIRHYCLFTRSQLIN